MHLAAFTTMLPRPVLWLTMALSAAGCAHPRPREQPAGVAAERGPAPSWWRPGPVRHPDRPTPSSLLDEANGLLHVATTSGVDVVRIADGAVVFRAKGRPLWVGLLDGRTRAFALSPDSVVELEPTTGRLLRKWSGAETVLPGLSRIEGGALVVEVVQPTSSGPNGSAVAHVASVGPVEPTRMFVPLDREGSVAIHRGPLAAKPAAQEASQPEVQSEGGMLWFVPTSGAPRVLLLDAAPVAGLPPTMFVDERQIVLLVTAPSGSDVVWLVLDAQSGAVRSRAPRERCGFPPRLVGEVLLCERTAADGRQQVVAWEPRTLELLWSHATLPLPAPSSYATTGH